MGINIVGTLVAVQGLKPRYEAHLKAGGRRASLLKPIGVTVVVLLVLGVIVGLVAPEDGFAE